MFCSRVEFATLILKKNNFILILLFKLFVLEEKTNKQTKPQQIQETIPFESQKLSVQFWVNYFRKRPAATYSVINIDLC